MIGWTVLKWIYRFIWGHKCEYSGNGGINFTVLYRIDLTLNGFNSLGITENSIGYDVKTDAVIALHVLRAYCKLQLMPWHIR